MKSIRLLSIDYLRGLAIIVLVVIHRLHYNWTGMKTHESLKEYMSGYMLPILIFLILLLSMAGVFYFITGIVNTYTMYNRVMSGKNKIRHILLFGIAGGFWLIVLNYFQRLFLMNGFLTGENGQAPKYPVGYLTGLIRNPDEVRFYWQQVTEPGTLSLIGLLLIVVTIIFGIILNYRKYLSMNQMQLILVVLAIAGMVASVFVKLEITPRYDEYFNSGQYFKAAFCGHICKDFSLFPYVGYALTGAALGLSLAAGENKKTVFKKSMVAAIALIVIGLLIFMVLDKNKFGGRGTLGALVSLAELSLFILFTYFLLKRFDYIPEDKKQIRMNKTAWTRRFGFLSLTVYLCEPILAELLKKPINWIAGNTWENYFGFVFLFAMLCLFAWYLILKYWEKIGYKGSFEWLTSKLLLVLTRKDSGKIIQNSPSL